MRRIALLCMLLAASGCRLSDPFYAAKPLEAPQAPAPEYSLLFVSVRGAPQLFSTPEIFSLWFRRVDPHGDNTPFVGGGDDEWFRAFRPRSVKDGDFLIVLPPGAYELEQMNEKGWGGTLRTWHVTGEAKAASRIHITRPGIYDLGTLRISEATWGHPAALNADDDAFSEERLRTLRAAVRGTQWEKLLDGAPRQRKREHHTLEQPSDTVASAE